METDIIFDLGGTWRLYTATGVVRPHYSDSHLNVSVPGEVHAQRASGSGDPDPFADQHYLAAIPREADHAWLARSFTRPAWAGEACWLVFEGIDCRSEVFLNGEYLGSFDGMFGGPEFEVTSLLREENELLVHILPAETSPAIAREFWGRGQIFEDDIGAIHRHLKQPLLMGGNGFPPRLVTAGIWLPVRLERRTDRDLADAWIQTVAISTDLTRADLALHLETWHDGDHEVEFVLLDPQGTVAAFGARRVTFVAGRASIPLVLPAPELWWPNGHGSQGLYRLKASLSGGPAIFREVGLRTARWVRTPGTDKALTMEVNGRRLYLGGASWSSGDRTLAFDRERYAWTLGLLREAHTTYLRVWAGIPREPRFFYELCDELGLLITQDFPLSNYANTPEVHAGIDGAIYERQVRHLVRDLRGHACVVGWIAGNELRADEVEGSGLSPIIDRAEHALRELDPDRDRLWLRSSYQLDRGWTDEYDHYGRRQSAEEELTAILDGEPRFAIEYYPGSQHALIVPDVRQVERFIPAASAVWPPPSWIHLRRINGSPWDPCFLAGTLPVDVHPITAAPYGSWEELAYYTQTHALSAIEAILGNWRGRWPEHAGSNLWHAADQYPVLSWGTIDFYGAPKGLYYGYKRGLAPVRAVMKYTRPRRDVRERLRGWVRVINAGSQPLSGYRVDIRFFDERFREMFSIGPEGSHALRAESPSGTVAPAGGGQAHQGILPRGGFRLSRARTSSAPVPANGVMEVFELNGVGYLFPYYQLAGLPDTSLDAEWGQPKAETPFSLLITLRAADGTTLSETCYPFNFDWHDSLRIQALEGSPVQIRFEGWTTAGEGSLWVKNSGAALLPWLELFSPDLAPDEFVLSDNFVALAPGDEKRIVLRLRHPKRSGAVPTPRFLGRGLNVAQVDSRQ